MCFAGCYLRTSSGKSSDKESQMSIHKEYVDFNTLNDNVVMQFYIYLYVCVYILYINIYTHSNTHAYTYMRKSKRKEIKRKEEEPESKTAK